METAIRTERVFKSYKSGRKRVDALKDVTLDIKKGIATVIAGPSGSGKTTLLSIIGLLARPSGGRVYIQDKEVSGISDIFRSRIRQEEIGFVFQNQYLLPQLTAVQNVALPFLATDTAIGDAEKQAKEQLSEFGLEDRLDFRVAELSGGEQQRVSIARGLMNNPSILIADEPSSSMEQDLVEYLLDLLRTMCDYHGLTVIVASHDPRILEWGDEVYRLSRGILVDTKDD